MEKEAASDHDSGARGSAEYHNIGSDDEKGAPNKILEKMQEIVGKTNNALPVSIKFDAMPTAPQLSHWKTKFMYKVAAASSDPTSAFHWIARTDRADTSEQLAEDGLLYEKEYAALESKIATGLMDILNGIVAFLTRLLSVKGLRSHGRSVIRARSSAR